MIEIFPEIKTDRLLLRQITQDDLPNIFRGLSHPEVIKYYGVNYQTLEATQDQMDWFADQEKNGTGLWWAVCSLDNKTFYGTGGFTDLQKKHRKAEVGFWLLPDYWGRGIMKEAMPLILDYGFKGLNLHRIEGFVESGNENCKRGLAKLDFIYEGTMKDCEIKNGTFLSVDIYAAFPPANDPD